jgi:hypothetical protein
MTFLASMPLQLFLLLSAQLLLASMLLSKFNHALAGTHALASVSEVVGSSVAGVVAL